MTLLDLPSDPHPPSKSGAARGRAADRRRPRRSAQLDLAFRSWGGRREGAGRKPNGNRAGVSHRTRQPVASGHPVHVTLRVRKHVYNLRSRRCFRVLERAFAAARERNGMRLVHFSVQGNHLHLIVEAQGREALARGIQGLSIRIARGLNRLMARRGKVFSDRYHAHVLRSPREVRHALAYVLRNADHHGAGWRTGRKGPVLDPYTSGRWFDGWRAPRDPVPIPPPASAPPPPPPPVASPRTWLLRAGWRRHGLVDAP